MGIFSRLADIVNSNLNAILANAEDPQKMIRLVIQEMEDTLVEVRSQAVRTIAERKQLERRVRTMIHDAHDWHRNAGLATQRDRDALARAPLAARHRPHQSRHAPAPPIPPLSAGPAQPTPDISKLQAKIADAKSREKALSIRARTAQGRLKTREKLYDTRIDDTLNRFDQVERALDELEGKAEAYDLGRRTGHPTLQEELAALETDAVVENEFEALKRRVAEKKSAG